VQGWRRYFYYFPTSARWLHELIRGATGGRSAARASTDKPAPRGTGRGVFHFRQGADMIIVLKPGSSEADTRRLERRVVSGIQDPSLPRRMRTIVGGRRGCARSVLALQSLDWRGKRVRISSPSSREREAHPEPTHFKVNGCPSAQGLVSLAGPARWVRPSSWPWPRGEGGGARSFGAAPSSRALALRLQGWKRGLKLLQTEQGTGLPLSPR